MRAALSLLLIASSSNPASRRRFQIASSLRELPPLLGVEISKTLERRGDGLGVEDEEICNPFSCCCGGGVAMSGTEHRNPRSDGQDSIFKARLCFFTFSLLCVSSLLLSGSCFFSHVCLRFFSFSNSRCLVFGFG